MFGSTASKLRNKLCNQTAQTRSQLYVQHITMADNVHMVAQIRRACNLPAFEIGSPIFVGVDGKYDFKREAGMVFVGIVHSFTTLSITKQSNTLPDLANIQLVIVSCGAVLIRTVTFNRYYRIDENNFVYASGANIGRLVYTNNTSFGVELWV